MVRTTVALVVAASFAIGVMIVQGSGVATSIGFGDDNTKSYVIDNKFEKQADKNPEAVGGSTGGQTTGLRFVVATLTTFLDFVKMGVMLPQTLSKTIIPWWAATPLGLGLQALTVWGMAEVASNREWT